MPADPPPLTLGPRIAIYGPSGSGKSTLARALSQKLGLPCVELDAIFHAHPNWVDLTAQEFRARVTGLLEQHPDGWVMDGNYSHVRDLVLSRADTVIWLRLPFRVVYPRLAWRTISRSFVHAPLWNGNRETLRQTFLSRESMLLWGITHFRVSSERTQEALAAIPHHARVIRLRKPRQVSRLVQRASLADGPPTAEPEGHG